MRSGATCIAGMPGRTGRQDKLGALRSYLPAVPFCQSRPSFTYRRRDEMRECLPSGPAMQIHILQKSLELALSCRTQPLHLLFFISRHSDCLARQELSVVISQFRAYVSSPACVLTGTAYEHFCLPAEVWSIMVQEGGPYGRFVGECVQPQRSLCRRSLQHIQTGL